MGPRSEERGDAITWTLETRAYNNASMGPRSEERGDNRVERRYRRRVEASMEPRRPRRGDTSSRRLGRDGV